MKAEARESARLHAEKIRGASEERQRNAAVAQHQREWAQYKVALQNLEQQQRAKEFWDNRMKLCDEMIASVNPPEPEPQVVYVGEDQGTTQLGHPNFNPKLIRW